MARLACLCRVRADAGDEGGTEVGEVVDVGTHAGRRDSHLDGPCSVVPFRRSRPEAGSEPVVRSGVHRRPHAGPVAHEDGTVGDDLLDRRGQHVGQLVGPQPRQVGAQRHRHGVRPAAYDLGRRLHERRVEVLARAVRHHLDSDPGLQFPHGRGQAEVVGDDQYGRHPAGPRGGLHGVEGERLGQLAALLVGEADQPGLAQSRGLHGYDDHAPVGGVWGRGGGGHHRRSCHPANSRRRRPSAGPTE